MASPRFSLTDFDVVLTGAGISIPQPSDLPSGDALTRMVWSWLYRSIDGPPDIGRRAEERIGTRRVGAEAGLRLEQLMEVAHRHVDIDQLVKVYRVMKAAPPGFTHLALAETGLPVLTVNMDRLLTVAGVQSVTHLHGRYDRPNSIKTTITQYSDGLSTRAQRLLRAGVKGKRLLVMGYSGRDRDVLPLIVEEFQPTKVTWVRFRFDPAFPEVEAARRRLEAQGIDFCEIVSSGQEFLHDELGINPDEGRYQLSLLVPTASTAMPIELEKVLYDKVPFDDRRLACASILFELALYSEARVILRKPFKGEKQLTASKMMARSLRRERRYWRAIEVLITAAARFGVARVINEISSAVVHTRLWPAARLIDAALIRRGSGSASAKARKVVRLAASRRRQHYINAGIARRALLGADYALAHPDELDRQSRLDESTWIADAEKLRGNYAKAVDIVEQSLRDAPYSDMSQRSYLLSKRVEIRLAAGLVDVGDPNGPDAMALEEADDFAAYTAPDGSERLWLRVVEAACYGHVPGRGRELLEEARGWLRAAIGTDHQFFLIHSAEQARFDGDYRLSRRELRRLSLHLPLRVVGRGRSWRWASRLVRAQSDIDRGRATRATQRRLSKLVRAYARAGMDSAAAWAEITLAKLDQTVVPTARIEEMRRRGWLAHVARVENPNDSTRWAVIV